MSDWMIDRHPLAAALFTAALLIAAVRPADAESVPLKQEGGTYFIPVIVNNKILLDFTIDSGAADVVIPADVFSTLIRTGTVSPQDFLSMQEYKLADGSKQTSPRFKVRLLRIGNIELKDVVASVAPQAGSLLLGQSFLSRIKSWSIDNERQLLLLNEPSPTSVIPDGAGHQDHETASGSTAWSKNFRCPESLRTDEARQADLTRFLREAMERNPQLTLKTVVELRTRLLEEHHCDRTLANIKLYSDSVKNLPRNLCTGEDKKRYFSHQSGTNCTPVPINAGWVNFRTWPNVVMDIMPSTIVWEPDGPKVWAQFFLAEPAPSIDGQWRYDSGKSVVKFYCRTKQQRLIQGTYSLNGDSVYERSSTDSILEEIEPETLAEALYHYACDQLRRNSANE